MKGQLWYSFARHSVMMTNLWAIRFLIKHNRLLSLFTAQHVHLGLGRSGLQNHCLSRNFPLGKFASIQLRWLYVPGVR